MGAVEFGVMQPFGDISKEEGKRTDGVKPRGYLCGVVVLIEDGEESKRAHEESSAADEVVEGVPGSPESRILYSRFNLHSIIIIKQDINKQIKHAVVPGSIR